MFTSLSLFALLTEPLGNLIMSLATFAGSIGSFDRIQAFLDQEARVDHRQKPAEQLLGSSLQNSHKDLSSQTSEVSTEKVDMTLSLKPEQDAATSADAIVVQDGSFGWDKDKEPILQSVDMTVPREKLTMLVGPVGCGKSTLLKALLGEVPAMKGTVSITSSEIAYCDQTPWHTNGSIRESIIAVSEYDERWYATVIHACALDQDLRHLPRGDQTQIGSNGIALSGGQSQRIVSYRWLRIADSQHEPLLIAYRR